MSKSQDKWVYSRHTRKARARSQRGLWTLEFELYSEDEGLPLNGFRQESCKVMFVFYLTLVFLIIFISCLGSSLRCAGFCLVVVSRGLLFVAMCGLLTEVASLAAELSCQGPAGLVAVTCGLWRVDSGVVVHRLSCFGVYGIFLVQGSNWCPLHW